MTMPNKHESSLSGESDAVFRMRWQDVLKRHQGWLQTVVLARVGDAAAVADVMQDVAAAAIENGHRLRDPSKVAPWLYRIAVVAALQYRRRIGRARKLTDRYAEQSLPIEADTSPDPLSWLVAEEQRELVRTALRKIPTHDAEMLLLKYAQDWSYQEIAEHLGIRSSTVESRLHRARKKLRTALRIVEHGVNPATK